MMMECDIIIPVWNQLEFTKDCIESIFRNTTEVDYRLIIIDNASDAPAKDYLEKLEALKKPLVKVVRNDVNLGFIKAVNNGMGLSEAPYVCLLNNDTLVYDGWLRTMINTARSSKDIGLVNPSSNNLGQRPNTGEPVELYAHRIKKESGNISELGAAIGFCMLIKREVINAIGVFDEIYGMGNFEDTDYSRRSVKAGYRCVRAGGAYVHHRENTSFKLIKSFNEDFQRNKDIFETRWGRTKRIAYVLDACDDNEMKRLESESMKLARLGNWVWFFFKDPVIIPDHSNIIKVSLSPDKFYLKAGFRILKKKKKFDEIYVASEPFAKVMNALSFVHNAEVKYY
jgi:GT2 family glycosyltransferase